MVVTAGIKDAFGTFNTIDGGDLTPGATVTTGRSVLGSAIDLLTDTVNGILPDEVALQIGVSMSALTTGLSGTGAATPTYEVFAQWLTQATTGTPTAKDDEFDLVANLRDVTPAVVNTVTAYTFGPSGLQIFATKGRYLKLKYKINAAANIAGTLYFGADWAGIYPKI